MMVVREAWRTVHPCAATLRPGVWRERALCVGGVVGVTIGGSSDTAPDGCDGVGVVVHAAAARPMWPWLSLAPCGACGEW